MSTTFSSEQLISVQRSALDSARAVVTLSLDNTEQFAKLAISNLRTLLDQGIESAQSLSGSKDLGETSAIHARLAQIQFESAFGYFRGLYDITSQAHAQLSQVFERQRLEFNDHISGSLDRISAKGQAEVAVAAVKSAISAANSAYDSAHRAARQVAEITDASINAATSATARSVGASPLTSARKKAA